MSKHHVVDVLAEEREVRSLSGLDLNRRVQIEVDDPRFRPEILEGDLVDVKHGRKVPSNIGIKQDDGRWVWRQVKPTAKVRFTQS